MAILYTWIMENEIFYRWNSLLMLSYNNMPYRTSAPNSNLEAEL